MQKVLSFYVGNTLFGVDIKLVKEINRNVEYTPIPDTTHEILGLFNMRGQIVTLFDFIKTVGFDIESNVDKNQCIILKPLGNDTSHIGFLIDTAGDVIDLENYVLEDKPANISNIESDFINSIAKLEDKLLIIIEPSNIFNKVSHEIQI